MFQLVIDENRMVVTQKMTLIETFCGGTMYNVHIEVESLVYIILYVYVGSRTIFSPVFVAWALGGFQWHDVSKYEVMNRE